MERHERYDPEDIESLLSERAFDELLPDERAFVLRHMSGRDEYERMRALLHYVRPDERERGTIEPEDRVRRNVMAAFRAQQQPQWRIWLNSIALWLAPKDAAASPHWWASAWRPALAFGSLALLIVAGVVAVQQFGGTDTPALAELKQEEKAPAPATAKDEAAVPEPQLDDAPAASGVETERSMAIPAQATEPPAPVREIEVADRYAESAGAATVNAEATEDFAAIMDVALEPDMKSQSGAPFQSITAEQAESLSHVVTANELSRNMSTTNALGEVAMKEAAKTPSRKYKAAQPMATSRSMADSPGILDLVASGW